MGLCPFLKAYVHRGVVPRAVERIFAEKLAKPEAGIVVHVSYLEVYNEVGTLL